MTTNPSLLTVWLLAGIGLSACSPGPYTLTVHVTGSGANKGDLKVIPRLAGQLGEEITVNALATNFTVTFDAEPAPDAVLDGMIRSDSGCLVASGSAQANFQGHERNQTKDMALRLFDPPVCPQCVEPVGQQWCSQPFVTGQSLQGVWADRQNDNAWAVGFGGIILHWNATSNKWLYEQSPAVDTLDAVWGTGPNDVWAVGLHGTILHTNGTLRAGCTPRTGSPPETDCLAWTDITPDEIRCPNPEVLNTCTKLNAIGGIDSEKEVWVAGSAPSGKNNIFSLDRSTFAVRARHSRADEIRSLWKTTDGLWLVGAKQHIELISDSVPMNVTPPSTPLQLNSIWGNGTTATSNLRAVGPKGFSCNKNGSADWACKPSDFKMTVLSISGDPTRNSLWGACEDGTIMKSSIDPFQFMPSPSATGQQLNSIFAVPGSSNGTVWAVGDSGTIVRFK